MKPFVLSLALAGKPLITMSGLAVSKFTRFPDLDDPKNVAVVHFSSDTRLIKYNDNGEAERRGSDREDLDLVMADSNFAYVNVFRRNLDNSFYFGAYHRGANSLTEMQAEKAAPPPELDSVWHTTLVGDPQGDPIGIGGI